jgi:hypothetical protein
MTTAASMQHNGLWGGGTPSYIDIDGKSAVTVLRNNVHNHLLLAGMYQVVRPAMALGTAEGIELAQHACQQYLPVLHKVKHNRHKLVQGCG